MVSRRVEIGLHRSMTRLVVEQLAVIIAEWAGTVGLLVYAHTVGGAGATGRASLALLSATLLGAPIAGALVQWLPPRSLRQIANGVQFVAWLSAAVFVSIGASLWVAVAAGSVAFFALGAVRPTGAVLLPTVVRSTSELTRGSVWLSHAESISAFAGPLLAAGLLAGFGASGVIGACAALSGVAVVIGQIDRRSGPGPRHSGGRTVGQRTMAASFLESIRRQPWALGVFVLATGRNLVVGAFDVLLVVLAFESFGLGAGGAGILTSTVGAGAALSVPVMARIGHRRRLRWPLLAVATVEALACLALAMAGRIGPALAVLVVAGAAFSLLDNLGRVLLQRTVPTDHVGPMVAMLGLVAGAAQLGGSLFAQSLVALDGADTALIGLAVVLFVLGIVSLPALRLADDRADVPLVEMELLGALPMFDSLDAAVLETVARSAETIVVSEPIELITQGAVGDTFYAVIDGAFDVEMSGTWIRQARRGDHFGEVALLADVPRTANVRSTGPATVLAIKRGPFLSAVTGHDSSFEAALDVVAAQRFDQPVKVSDRRSISSSTSESRSRTETGGGEPGSGRNDRGSA